MRVCPSPVFRHAIAVGGDVAGERAIPRRIVRNRRTVPGRHLTDGVVAVRGGDTVFHFLREPVGKVVLVGVVGDEGARPGTSAVLDACEPAAVVVSVAGLAFLCGAGQVAEPRLSYVARIRTSLAMLKLRTRLEIAAQTSG